MLWPPPPPPFGRSPSPASRRTNLRPILLREAGEGDHAQHGGGGGHWAQSTKRIDQRPAHSSPPPPSGGPVLEACRSSKAAPPTTHAMAAPSTPLRAVPLPRFAEEEFAADPPPQSGGGGPCAAWWRGRPLGSIHEEDRPETRAQQPSTPFGRSRAGSMSLLEGRASDNPSYGSPLHPPSGGPPPPLRGGGICAPILPSERVTRPPPKKIHARPHSSVRMCQPSGALSRPSGNNTLFHLAIKRDRRRRLSVANTPDL